MDMDLYNRVTPMMQHYLEMKDQYKDCIMFYRLGDFYEMFFEDAITVSRELELTLTGKSCGMEERAPMCGIPFHAYESYLTRLIEKGYKVAICEQMEDPKLAKGMVKRDVIRVVTPGTNLNPTSLEEGKNNFLMGVFYGGDAYGIATVDVSTGDFYVTEVSDVKKIVDEIMKFAPSELVYNPSFLMCGISLGTLSEQNRFATGVLEERFFDNANCERVLKEHFHVVSLSGLGLTQFPIGTIAAGAVMQYLNETQKTSLAHITQLQTYTTGKYMILDFAARRNLELTETLREKQKRGTLLWVLDKTKTAMGARLLRSSIEQPLLVPEEINQRLDAVAELVNDGINRAELREYLSAVYDLERLLSKVTYHSANPRDLLAFQTSLSMLQPIRTIMKDFSSQNLAQAYEELDPLSDLSELIEKAIDPDAPLNVKEGGIIKSGYSEEVDHLRLAKTEGKNWLTDIEEREKNATGIKNLRIKYNRVFGYYFEVTNSYQNLVPQTWIRKQTLTNAERYTTPELKKLEEEILGAEDKLFSLEYDLFSDIRDRIAAEVNRIQKTAKAIAKLDFYASLAHVAEKNRYVRPTVTTDGVIDIKGGRHPVVEQMITNDMFVENDTYLDNKDRRVSIITGPNMAGKSTYMRQTALLVLMAQIGCFVPANEAKIGIVDRIFTRVGASDDLASGQSTFMVEMSEVANILRNATKNSLLILDEIGRGTSTFDGLSIAWSVVEHIADTNKIGAKALFATHYHELTQLEGKLSSVHNYCIAVKEQGEDIIFLRKIIPGGADKSYGIQVARLAGVPQEVLSRAREILEELSENDLSKKTSELSVGAIGRKRAQKQREELEGQMTIFGNDESSDITRTIAELNLSVMTPIDALNMLYTLQEKAKK